MKKVRDTAATEVANQIGKKILSGEIAEGQKLKVLDITQEYNVSQTVAREALLILGQSYLVENYPRRGCFARSVKASDAIDLYEIKKRLLGYAIQCICKSYSKRPELRGVMVQRYTELLNALQQGDAEAAHLANLKHTDTILNNLENVFLRDSLNNIESQIKRFYVRNAFQTEIGRTISVYYITQLLKAQDDPHLAEKCMLDYLDAVKEFAFQKNISE